MFIRWFFNRGRFRRVGLPKLRAPLSRNQKVVVRLSLSSDVPRCVSTALARILKCADATQAYVAFAGVCGILFFATVTADADLTGDTRPTFELSAPVARSLTEPRSARLARFFRLYRCPEPMYISEYLRIADENRLDYRLLPAISIRETQCGVHENRNNRLGYHPEEASFPTVLAGIEFIGKRLAEHPYYRGKDIAAKLFRYNPMPAYPDEVQRIMHQIEP
jgi:hypothetical protein